MIFYQNRKGNVLVNISFVFFDKISMHKGYSRKSICGQFSLNYLILNTCKVSVVFICWPLTCKKIQNGAHASVQIKTLIPLALFEANDVLNVGENLEHFRFFWRSLTIRGNIFIYFGNALTKYGLEGLIIFSTHYL